MNLEPLELRWLKDDLVMYYKCLSNPIALPSDECFCQQHPVSQTRPCGDRLIAPLCRTNHFQNNFFYRCLNCYNNLPAHVVNANSVFSFKKHLNNTDLYVFFTL